MRTRITILEELKDALKVPDQIDEASVDEIKVIRLFTELHEGYSLESIFEEAMEDDTYRGDALVRRIIRLNLVDALTALLNLEPRWKDLPELYEERQDTPLHKACYQGHTDQIKTLLAFGANFEACDRSNVVTLFLDVKNQGDLSKEKETRDNNIRAFKDAGCDVLALWNTTAEYDESSGLLTRRCSESLASLFEYNYNEYAEEYFSSTGLSDNLIASLLKTHVEKHNAATVGFILYRHPGILEGCEDIFFELVRRLENGILGQPYYDETSVDVIERICKEAIVSLMATANVLLEHYLAYYGSDKIVKILGTMRAAKGISSSDEAYVESFDTPLFTAISAACHANRSGPFGPVGPQGVRLRTLRDAGKRLATLFLQHGADANAVVHRVHGGYRSGGLSMLEYILYRGVEFANRVDMAELLIEHGATFTHLAAFNADMLWTGGPTASRNPAT